MQVRIGTATLTNNSTRVIFSDDTEDSDFSLIVAGDIFVTDSHRVPYFVAAMTDPGASLSGFWEATLSAPYMGDTEVGIVFSLNRDFTANYDIPMVNKGDLHSDVLFTRAMAIIDALLGSALGDDPDSLEGRVAALEEAVEALEARFNHDKRLVFSYVADCGQPGAVQTAIAALIAAMAPNYCLFGGDNTYTGGSGANFNADWAAFAAFFNVSYPVLGNHDDDRAGITAEMLAKFPHLPTNTNGHKRYWNIVLGNGLIEIFGLHSGWKTDHTSSEPDGNAVASTQHAWFVAAVNASTAKWKVVMMHHPFLQTVSAADRSIPALNWNFENYGIDLILHGHNHHWEIVNYKGMSILNGGGTAHSITMSNMRITGALASPNQAAWVEFTHDTAPAVGKLTVTENSFRIEVFDTAGTIIFSRDLTQFAKNTDAWDFEVMEAAVEDMDIIYPSFLIGATLPRHMILEKGIRVSTVDNLTRNIDIYISAEDELGNDLGNIVTNYTLAAGKSTYVIPMSAITRHQFRGGSKFYVSLEQNNVAYLAEFPVNGLALALLGRYVG